MVCVTDIQQLTLEWEDTIEVSANHGKATNGQGLGRVSLGDNESTVLGLGSSSIVGIVELGNSGQLCLLGTALALECLVLLELGIRHDGIHDTALLNCLHEFVRELDLRESGGADSHVLLRLTVKGGILHETVHEDGKVVLDLIRLDLRTSLVLLLHRRLKLLRHLIGNVVHVSTTLRGRNAIHERYLLKASIGYTHSDLPVIVDLFIGSRRSDSIKQGKIGLEVFHFQLLAIKIDAELLPSLVSHGACNIVGTLGEQANGISIHSCQTETLKIRLERDLCVVTLLLLRLGALLNLGFFLRVHVITEYLGELQPLLRIETLNNKLRTENVGKLGAISVTAAGRLLLVIVKVGSRQ
mmetsp:Transcript_13500/g.29331  ORF Transcript_13500/g.29331 Transcript_13500/m.29331 type:complete len:355 (-) Transcript_13500:606-1670(-)